MHNTIKKLSDALQNGEFSSEELIVYYLDKCEKNNTHLNCFISLLSEQAIEQAKNADKLIKNGNAKPLTGIPIAHKDILCMQHTKTSCGSKMLDNFIAPYDATVVSRLRDSGMITLGKTNMDEFAMGSSNETSFYGTVNNPWDTTCIAGGSSGGSAAAVAAQLTPAATGTDTGGSIRQPASLCGITGLKPTYGRVSRYGIVAYASSLEQCGPMTQTAEDAALMLNVMAGFDARDSTSAKEATEDYSKNINQKISGVKIGVPKEYFDEKLDGNIAKTIHASLHELTQAGARITEISLPSTHLSIPAYYVIASAECSSNLARFDGVHFGHRCKDPQDINDLYLRSRAEGFGKEVKRRIITGTFVLSEGYYDAYYLKAQKIRRLIQNEFCQALAEVDVIISPVTQSPAYKLNQLNDDLISMYLSDIYTVPANLVGLPAISIPVGLINELPVGMQIIGNYFAESKLLNIAHQFQKLTDWHQKNPQNTY